MLLRCQSRFVVAVTVPACVVFAFEALGSYPTPLAVELRDCCSAALLLLLLLQLLLVVVVLVVVVNCGCGCHRRPSPDAQDAQLNHAGVYVYACLT